MAMASRLLLVIVAVALGVMMLAINCNCTSLGHMPPNKDKKGESESWANWAKEKISQGLGFKHDNEPKEGKTKKASDYASQIAQKAKEYAADTAQKTKAYAIEAAQKAKERVSDYATHTAQKKGFCW